MDDHPTEHGQTPSNRDREVDRREQQPHIRPKSEMSENLIDSRSVSAA
jgi:hypothetical protein